MLVRAADRQREWAIRLAIGASGGRLARQVLTESVVFGALGGGLGLALGIVGIRALLAIGPGDIPRIAADGSDVLVDWRMLLFAVMVSMGTSVVVGLIPAMRASRVDVESSLRSGGDRAGAGLTHERTRALLVAAQVALACMLLVGTALLLRSFIEMHRVHPGFESARVLTMTTFATDARYARTEATARMIEESVEAVRAVPGVEVVGATMTGVPLEGEKSTLRIGVAAQTDRNVMGGWHIISPDYFTVLRTPILRGRGITPRDTREATPVAIVNQALARRLWPTGDPIGDRVIVGMDGGPDFADVPRQVVGIVGDIRQGRLDREPRPAVYVPLAQLPDVEMAFLNRNSAAVTWMVRTSGAPHLVDDAVQQALRRATDAPVARMRSLEEIAALSTVGTQFRIRLMTLFAGSALLLAAIGIYGVASYSVQRRTREIGVRVALGATPEGIRRLVLMLGLRSTAIGLVAGLIVAFAFARVLARFLFAVDPRDPFVFAIVPCVLALVALTAVWLPARRATRIEPVRALRMD